MIDENTKIRAPEVLDFTGWGKRLRALDVPVAETGAGPLGFIGYSADGHVDLRS